MLIHFQNEEEVLDILKNRSRDNSRTPMQWNNEENSGFTKGTPWIKVSKNFKYINAELEKKKSSSILNYYKDLIDLRRNNKIICEGSFVPVLEEHSKILAYIREYEGNKILVVCNFYGEKTMASLNELEDIKTDILISNSDENKIVEDKIFLSPYGCIVISLDK